MKNTTCLGVIFATLVPVSWQIIDEFGGNIFLVWKILQLYYGLFGHHGLAVVGHLSTRDRMRTIHLPSIGLSDLKNCKLEEQNKDQIQVLFLPQQCISDRWVCEWTNDGYKERFSLQLTVPFDCGKLGKVPWNELPEQVDLSFISTSTCSVVWRKGDATCYAHFPAGETTYAFVGGVPHFLGILDIDPAGCRWETTFLHCHRAVNIDGTDEESWFNKREDIDGRSLGKKPDRISAKIEDLPQKLKCTWDTDVMQPQRLSVASRIHYLCADPGEDLEDPVDVTLSYDGSCTMRLDYQTTSCTLEVPKEKNWHAFLFGDSKEYPYLIGMLGQGMDKCIWQQNLMLCEQR